MDTCIQCNKDKIRSGITIKCKDKEEYRKLLLQIQANEWIVTSDMIKDKDVKIWKS